MIQKGNHVQDPEKSGQENSHVSIWHILKMLLPYKWQTAGAVAALLFTAVSTLSIGIALYIEALIPPTNEWPFKPKNPSFSESIKNFLRIFRI